MNNSRADIRSVGREQLRRITDALPALIAYIDRDQRYVFVNSAYTAEFHRETGDTVGHTVREVLGEDNYIKVRPYLEAVLRGDGPQRYEYEMRVPNSVELRTKEAIYAPQLSDNGTIVGCTALVIDITERNRAEAASARLAAVVQHAGVAVIGVSLGGLVESWNLAAERLFGYAAAEMVGQPISRLAPADRANEPGSFAKRLRAGEAIGNVETVRVAKDGRHIDVLLSPAAIKDGNGNITGVSATLTDITERKAAEQTQKLLVDELNHRVKNMLATLQAMAEQTLRNTKDPAHFVESFSGRVQALARAHNLLTRTTWAGADLETLLREQLLLGAGQDKRITCAGPEVTLGRQAAVHLGLVLHELGTNARKYGSLSVPEGSLSVTWSVAGEGAGAALQLDWRESGGPEVVPPRASGFGTLLVERALKHSLGGEACLEFASAGLRCAIRLSLPARERGLHRTAVARA